MTTFIAVYRGETVATAKVVALSVDPTIVLEFAEKLLAAPLVETDAILREIEEGRRKGLRLISTEPTP